MLQSFVDRDAEAVWPGLPSRRIHPDIHRIARRKLAMLNAAAVLEDCRVPPGNRLEKLRGGRSGRYSIRTDGGPADVEIVDYH